MHRLSRVALGVLGTTAPLLAGCNGLPFTSALEAGGGVNRVGVQTEMASLSSLALDPSQEFVAIQAKAGSPVNALQASDSATSYYVVETFERDPSVSISNIAKMIAELRQLGDQLRSARTEQTKAEQQAVEAARAAEQAANERAKKLQDMMDAMKASAQPGPDGNKTLAADPTMMSIMSAQDDRTKAADRNAAEAKAAAQSKATKTEQLEGNVKSKEEQIKSALSTGNVIVVDWNQLGAGNLSASAGPVRADASGSKRGNGIAILNGIRKVRHIAPNSVYDDRAPGNEPFGDSFERPRSTSYMLQTREVLYFAIDDEALAASAKLDPKAAPTGGWDVGADAGLARLRQLTNFGALRTPTVESKGTLSLKDNDGWITVQVVGTPRHGVPRSRPPAGQR